jgi:iron complex outermembrane receptor protein
LFGVEHGGVRLLRAGVNRWRRGPVAIDRTRRQRDDASFAAPGAVAHGLHRLFATRPEGSTMSKHQPCLPHLARPSSPRMHHALAVAAIAALHGGASAQQTPPVEAGKLETITVTAERRVENLQAVPNSVSVLQGEMLDVLGTSGQDLRGLSGRVPSLNIESSFGRAFPRFYIRGYGNTDFRLNASQPVSLVYDDVVQENPILKGFPVFDIARIEVLRGPQGTLFGRNTPAGVVKFDSVRPVLGKSEGYGSMSIGTFSTVNAEGALNIPLGDSSALRFSLLNQTRDDWVENTFAGGPTQDLEGYRDSALRMQWLFESKDFSALANVHARDYSGSARLFRANIIEPGTNNLVAGFDEEQISIDGKNESELQNYGANLRLRWNLNPSLALHSITGFETVKTFSRGDIDGGYGFDNTFLGTVGEPGFIPFPSETADGMPKHTQWTQEFRLESDSKGPLNWQAGVFLFKEDYKVESFSYNSPAGNAQDGYQRIRQTNDAWAVFGALTYAVSPELELRGGLRYTVDKKKLTVEDYYANGYAPCIGPTIGDPTTGPVRCTMADLIALEPDGDLSSSPKDKKPSWDLSGTYALNKDVNLYARVANGFRGSSVQSASAFNTKSVADAETNTSVEAGVKADLFDRRARVNFGVFSYRVKDLQLTAVGGAGNANILLNAEEASGQGFELELQALLTDNLLATLGVGYNDTKIKDKDLAVSVCAQCTVSDPIDGSGKALIDGNPLPQAPKTTVNFTARYSIPTPSGEWYAHTDWVYRSKINFFLYESVEFTGKSLTEGGVRLGYVWGNGKYDAAIFGRNITDQIRVVGGIDFNNLTGFINEPRTWGVQFKASF